MARPVVNVIAERIYEEIAPVTLGDEENDWLLLHFIHAWTNSMMMIEDIARDTDEGPGWSKVMHPDTAPALFLNWLSMFVGSRPWQGETEEQARIRIKGMSGLRRGSAQAMRAIAQRWLMGEKHVIFNERAAGSAYRLMIRTLQSETEDAYRIGVDLQEQKPAGIVMSYLQIEGITWDTVLAAWDTWDEVQSNYATWGHVMTDMPI